MKTANKKRSITINGYKTSVSLEREFFDGLQEIAEHEKITREELIEQIDARRNTVNLSSAIRIFVLRYFRTHAGRGKVINLSSAPPTRKIKSTVLRALAR